MPVLLSRRSFSVVEQDHSLAHAREGNFEEFKTYTIVNGVNPSNYHDSENNTVLHWTVHHCDLAMTRFALEYFTIYMLQERNIMGETALFIAARKAREAYDNSDKELLQTMTQVIDALLLAGARADIRDSNNRLPEEVVGEPGLNARLHKEVDDWRSGKRYGFAREKYWQAEYKREPSSKRFGGDYLQAKIRQKEQEMRQTIQAMTAVEEEKEEGEEKEAGEEGEKGADGTGEKVENENEPQDAESEIDPDALKQALAQRMGMKAEKDPASRPTKEDFAGITLDYASKPKPDHVASDQQGQATEAPASAPDAQKSNVNMYTSIKQASQASVANEDDEVDFGVIDLEEYEMNPPQKCFIGPRIDFDQLDRDNNWPFKRRNKPPPPPEEPEDGGEGEEGAAAEEEEGGIPAEPEEPPEPEVYPEALAYWESQKPVFLPTYLGSIDDVTQLLAEGGTIYVRDELGRSPLEVALIFDEFELFQAFLVLGLEPSALTVFTSIRLHKPEYLEALLEAGAKLHVRDVVTKRTPLLEALELSSNECVRVILMSDQADLLMRTRLTKQLTPMMVAASTGNYVMLEIIIECTGQKYINERTKGSLWTPLFHAAVNGNEEMALLLIDFGADAHAVDKWGRNPLYYAATNNHVELVKIFLGVKEQEQPEEQQQQQDGEGTGHESPREGEDGAVDGEEEPQPANPPPPGHVPATIVPSTPNRNAYQRPSLGLADDDGALFEVCRETSCQLDGEGNEDGHENAEMVGEDSELIGAAAADEPQYDENGELIPQGSVTGIEAPVMISRDVSRENSAVPTPQPAITTPVDGASAGLNNEETGEQEEEREPTWEDFLSEDEDKGDALAYPWEEEGGVLFDVRVLTHEIPDPSEFHEVGLITRKDYFQMVQDGKEERARQRLEEHLNPPEPEPEQEVGDPAPPPEPVGEEEGQDGQDGQDAEQPPEEPEPEVDPREIILEPTPVRVWAQYKPLELCEDTCVSDLLVVDDESKVPEGYSHHVLDISRGGADESSEPKDPEAPPDITYILCIKHGKSAHPRITDIKFGILSLLPRGYEYVRHDDAISTKDRLALVILRDPEHAAQLERIKMINVADFQGRSGFFNACVLGYEDVVVTLLQYGADPSTPCELTSTRDTCPLFAVIENNHQDLFNILIDAGVDVNLRLNNTDKSFHLAMKADKYDMACQLVYEADYDVNEPFDPTPGAEVSLLRKCLELGKYDYAVAVADRLSPETLQKEAADDYVVFEACSHEALGMVAQLLIQQNPPCLHKTWDKGRNLLFYAGEYGSHSTLAALLEAGVDPTVMDSCGATLLHVVAARGTVTEDPPLPQAFLTYVDNRTETRTEAATTERGDDDTNDPLGDADAPVSQEGGPADEPAQEDGNAPKDEGPLPDMLQMVLPHFEGNMDPTDKRGRTPLFHASSIGDLTIVQGLLDAGADTRARDRERRSPLFCAAISGNPDVIGALIAKDEAANHLVPYTSLYDKKKQTALFWAAVAGHTDCAEALIAAGSELDDHDKHSQRAVMCALAAKQKGMVEFLLSKGAILLDNDTDIRGRYPMEIVEEHFGDDDQFIAMITEALTPGEEEKDETIPWSLSNNPEEKMETKVEIPVYDPRAPWVEE